MEWVILDGMEVRLMLKVQNKGPRSQWRFMYGFLVFAVKMKEYSTVKCSIHPVASHYIALTMENSKAKAKARIAIRNQLSLSDG